MNDIEKNTVSSKNQLKENSCVTFLQENGKGLKVMFVGNSITKHSPKPEIGWYGDWGMAASAPQKDYVHILIKKINEIYPGAKYCICHVSNWEREYKNGSEHLKEFEEARNFGADLIIFRLIENCPCPRGTFDKETFYNEYKKLIDYLNLTGKAKIIVTTGFWRHPGDEIIERIAKERNYPCAFLGPVGDDNSSKAIGLFEHTGVSIHPGDLGMQRIAEAILKKL